MLATAFARKLLLFSRTVHDVVSYYVNWSDEKKRDGILFKGRINKEKNEGELGVEI